MKRLVLVFTLALTGAAAAETAPDPLAEGKAIFARSCARCHRDPAKVLEGVNWALTERMPAERAVWLRDFILNHHSPGDSEATLVAKYLASL